MIAVVVDVEVDAELAAAAAIVVVDVFGVPAVVDVFAVPAVVAPVFPVAVPVDIALFVAAAAFPVVVASLRGVGAVPVVVVVLSAVPVSAALVDGFPGAVPSPVLPVVVVVSGFPLTGFVDVDDPLRMHSSLRSAPHHFLAAFARARPFHPWSPPSQREWCPRSPLTVLFLTLIFG